MVVIFITNLSNFKLQHALSIAQSYFHISPCPQEHFFTFIYGRWKKVEWNIFGDLLM